MALSRHERRCIRARQFLSIVLEPLSDGQWSALVMNDGVALYTSPPKPSAAEALPHGIYELDAYVERVMESEDREVADPDSVEVKSMNAPREHFGQWG